MQNFITFLYPIRLLMSEMSKRYAPQTQFQFAHQRLSAKRQGHNQID